MKHLINQKLVAAQAHRRGPSWRPQVYSKLKTCDLCGTKQGYHNGQYVQVKNHWRYASPDTDVCDYCVFAFLHPETPP